MEAWRKHLLAAREQAFEDDEEDEMNLRWIIGLEVDTKDLGVPKVRGGSCLGKAQNIGRDRMEMHERMMRDYFSESPVYSPSSF